MPHNYWARLPESLRSATREAAALRSPHATTREQHLPAATRESPHSNGDPAQPEINKWNFQARLKFLSGIKILKCVHFHINFGITFFFSPCNIFNHPQAINLENARKQTHYLKFYRAVETFFSICLSPRKKWPLENEMTCCKKKF